MSVWGRSAQDVWTVGSDPGDGGGALVLHFDGRRWTRFATHTRADLWWVHGFDDGSVFMAGSSGVVLRYDGGKITRLPPLSHDGTVFGIWGPRADDLWAVGGDLDGGTGGFVFRYDGRSWANVDVSTVVIDPSVFFKVWGVSGDDVWLVGSDGLLLHYDGNEFSRVETGTSDPLFTVHAVRGATTRSAAVGGFDLGTLLETGIARTWIQAPLPSGTHQLFGVWLTSDEAGYAVGAEARVLRRTARAWVDAATGLATDKTLHSVWVDPDDGVWSVGGDLLTAPLGAGVLIHRGAPVNDDIDVVDAGPVWTEPAEASAPDPGHPVSFDASVSVFDASSRAPMTADASTDSSSNEGFVDCGDEQCDLTQQRCCVDPKADVARCWPISETCLSGFALSCDERADCMSGQSCCVFTYIQLGTVSDVTCSSVCSGETLCTSSADCSGRALCGASRRIPGRHACH